MLHKTVRYFYPGKTITLFDCHKQNIFKGVLYINPKLIEQIKLLKRLSFISLIIFLVGIVSLTAPIAFAAVHSKLYTLPINKEKAAASFGSFVSDRNDFKIIVPKIGLESSIVPNVDITSEEIYKQQLQYGIAHANGSYFPGQKGLVFLFAHSTDSIARMLEYNAKFMDIYKLDIGDSVQINYQGKLYQYNITNKKVISPQDLELVRQTDSDLVLSTCWPLGTDWLRLVLFAVLTN